MHPEQEPLARNDFGNAINRCIKAYREVRAKLPPNADGFDRAKNKEAASDAYLKELPLLIDPQSFQLYIACISHGASLGIIDPVDVGRFCHIATTAISAWKLVNLIIPAANARERAAEEKQAKQSTAPGSAGSADSASNRTTPLPSKGNHSGEKDGQSQAGKGENKAAHPPTKGNQGDAEPLPYEDWESLYASTKLPDWKTQLTLFQSLRDRGTEIPTDDELRDNPVEALRHCETARYFEKCRHAAAANKQSPEPKKEPAPLSPQPAKEQPPAQQQQPPRAA